MSKANVILCQNVKGKNKRMKIRLVEDIENGERFFIVNTTTLKDFMKRDILRIENTYTFETFMVLSQSFSNIINLDIMYNILSEEAEKSNNNFTAQTAIYDNSPT